LTIDLGYDFGTHRLRNNSLRQSRRHNGYYTEMLARCSRLPLSIIRPEGFPKSFGSPRP
jgi:hypothetical protein